MIDPNILKILQSTMNDPSFSIVITEFEQPEFCNKDQLRINLQQFNPNLEQIIENKEDYIALLKQQLKDHNITIPPFNEISINSVIDKTLVIDSVLDVNKKDALYISGLKGIIDKSNESQTTSRVVIGRIKNKTIKIENKDYPNYFNHTKFKLTNNHFVINVPTQINTIAVKMKVGSTETIYRTIVDNKVTIPVNYNQEYSFTITYTLRQDLTNQDIECVITEIQKNLQIKFNNTYKDLPSIIPTIDERNKIYSSYELLFDRNEHGYYTGVTIAFKNFKRTQYHGDINIIIIGEKID